MDEKIREKIEHLIRLAERPGTPAEGENAKKRAIELSIKYGIPCKFTTKTAPPKTKPIFNASVQADKLMNDWVVSLKTYGWVVSEQVSTKVGRQLRFRKNGRSSEIRVTQRKGGTDFEAEHIGNPDPGPDGKDWSYSMYTTLYLHQLLAHVS
jgi:hypothetical protein